jgi:DNA-directed RNA polymerase subunit RPC12/RpoP
MKFRCSECSEEFESLDEWDLHAETVHDGQEVTYELIDENLELNEEEKENLTIEDSGEPEEILDQETSMTEGEVRGAIVLQSYSNIEDETLKKEILSVALGQSTEHNKKFAEPVKTSDAEVRFYEEALGKLLDKNSVACPYCGLSWERLYGEIKGKKEELSKEEIEKSFPTLRILHVKSEHKGVYELIKGLFTPEREEGDDALPSGELMPNQTGAPNPEQCTEELSKEELAEAISSDPELRRQFYLQAFRKLSNRN